MVAQAEWQDLPARLQGGQHGDIHIHRARQSGRGQKSGDAELGDENCAGYRSCREDRRKDQQWDTLDG